MVLLYLLGSADVATGFYMMYSATRKEKKLKLPKKNRYGLFAIGPKQGQEWLLFIIGFVWSAAWVIILLAVLLGWRLHTANKNNRKCCPLNVSLGDTILNAPVTLF